MLTRIIQKDQNLIIFENQELTRKNGIVYNITLTSFHQLTKYSPVSSKCINKSIIVLKGNEVTKKRGSFEIIVIEQSLLMVSNLFLQKQNFKHGPIDLILNTNVERLTLIIHSYFTTNVLVNQSYVDISPVSCQLFKCLFHLVFRILHQLSHYFTQK